MQIYINLTLLAAGIIHLLPLSGILGGSQLHTLYGVNLTDPSLEILMRHRAVLFGLLGVFLIFASFNPSLQTIALIGALISTVSFCALAWRVGDYNVALNKVFYIDLVISAFILFALLLRLMPNLRA